MSNKKVALIFFLGLTVCGCAATNSALKPKLTKDDQAKLKATALPFTYDYLYVDALAALGNFVNENGDFKVKIQPKQIGNEAGGKELPYRVTDMVITAVSRMSGDRFTVLPFDPDYINDDYVTGGQGSRLLPNYLISGSITEFDKDIEANESDLSLDILLGGGRTETDLGFSKDGSQKMSRVAIDLQILSYKNHAVVPGVFVSNTVNVMEIERSKDFGFAIYGSGLGISGKIKRGQGFHRAVRNLVEYSVLQLFGKFYNVPYWHMINMEYPDTDVLNSIRKAFNRKKPVQQYQEIQTLLNRVNKDARQLAVDGTYNINTKNAVQDFVNIYAPNLDSNDLADVYIKLREITALNTLNYQPRQNLATVNRNTASQKGAETETQEQAREKSTPTPRGSLPDNTRTTPKKYYDLFD